MTRPSLKHLAALTVCGGLLSACGLSQEIALDDQHAGDERMQRGAQIFYDKCAGCHTLDVAASEGSAFDIADRERVDGPNFNTRPVSREDVLYAIRNGGYSGAIMPENIVVGEQAEVLADYLAEYAGRDAEEEVTPQSPGADPAETP
jgi:mono/diheme cytochrome c family protein